VKRGVAGAALVPAWFVAGVAGAAEVESLRTSGPAADRFNIAVLGDGYRAEDQAKLKTDAQGIIDYLFSVPPLKQYGAFFNVKLVHVISNENGADNGSYGVTRDTALGAHFKCDNIDRLLCIDDGAAAVAAARDVPEYNFAIVIVNDPKYGGSGGPVCASSSNEQSFEVLAHEIGHSLAHLADEYSYEGNQPPCSEQADCREANATLRTSLDQIKWKDWIEQGTPLPTPATDQYGKITGLFEGTRYTPTGVYRPQLNCKMRDLGADYCTVCTEQFVRSIWTADNIKMIEQTTPAQPAVQSDSCDAIELSVKSPPITPSTYRYTWSVDGMPQTEATNEISLWPGTSGPRGLMQGDHQVAVTVEDATALVRSDPDGILKDEFTWTVSVAKSDCPVQMPGGAGGGGAGGSGAGGTLGGGSSGAGGVAGGLGGAQSAAGAGSIAGAPSSVAGSAGAARPNPPPRETSGCGCSVPGSESAPTGALLAWTLALALGRRLSARRRLARTP
jgi:uncharacterized membrane protein YgcG